MARGPDHSKNPRRSGWKQRNESAGVWYYFAKKEFTDTEEDIKELAKLKEDSRMNVTSFVKAKNWQPAELDHPTWSNADPTHCACGAPWNSLTPTLIAKVFHKVLDQLKGNPNESVEARSMTQEKFDKFVDLFNDEELSKLVGACYSAWVDSNSKYYSILTQYQRDFLGENIGKTMLDTELNEYRNSRTLREDIKGLYKARILRGMFKSANEIEDGIEISEKDLQTVDFAKKIARFKQIDEKEGILGPKQFENCFKLLKSLAANKKFFGKKTIEEAGVSIKDATKLFRAIRNPKSPYHTILTDNQHEFLESLLNKISKSSKKLKVVINTLKGYEGGGGLIGGVCSWFSGL